MNSIETWNERLQAARRDMELGAKWNRRLENLNAEIARQQRTVDASLRRLAEEQEDVERLTSSSFAHFFLGLFGRLEEKLSKEEKEAAEAKLKYDASYEALQGMERERTELIGQLAEVGEAEADYRTLMAEKERWIQAHDTQAAESLERLSEKSGKMKAMLVELAEAVRAGNRVLRSLEGARKMLSSAKSWGTYDMFGGGVIASAVKHGKIDDARKYIHTAQNDLRIFRKELADLNWNLDSDTARMDGLLTFADFFFDGLLVDWMVQGKIKNSLESVDSQLGDVERLLDRLKQEERRLEAESVELEECHRETVENYVRGK